MTTPVIALALAILIVSPAFTQSANATEAPRTKICDGSQPREYSGDYPGYPSTWCYWW
jgi:hypothetical protein